MQKDLCHSFELPRVTLPEADTFRQRSFSAEAYLHGGQLKAKTEDLPLKQSALKTTLNTSRYKTELCRPYQEYGYCKYGDKCQFAHGTQDLRSLPRHPKYKTELCRTFHSTGYCPYGPRCHFIHNKGEARQTQPTLNFPNNGTGPSIPRPILQPPPPSPSQDSGISSPDETASFFIGSGKIFEFPLSDSSSEEADVDPLKSSGSQTTFSSYDGWSYYPTSAEQDTYNDWDSVSSESLTPVKPLVSPVNEELSERFSTISLDGEIFTTQSHSRLPVFDMLNSRSDTALTGLVGSSTEWL